MNDIDQLADEPSTSRSNIVQGTQFRFEIQMKEAVIAINDALVKLEDLQRVAKANHDSVNIGKSVGTVASVCGTAVTVGAAVLSRFTGGESVMFLIGGAGLVAGIGGAVTNATTSIIDNRRTKECIERLERCLRNVQTNLKNLNKHIEMFIDSLELVKQKYQLHGDTETLIIKRYAKLAGQKWKSASKAAVLLSSKELMDSVRTMKAMGDLSIESAGGSFQLFKPVEQLTAIDHRAIQVFASKGGPVTVAKTTSSLMSKVTLLFSIASAIFEVYDLVRNWEKSPAEEAVDRAISTLLEEREALENLILEVRRESFFD